jgi:HSP20 family protein
MAVMRWDPFADIDRFFELAAGRGTSGGGGGQPAARPMAMDVYREGDSYLVEMDLPGVDMSSIDIGVERNLLTVEAESKAVHEEADEVLLCERRHTRYRRQLYLGENVDTDNVGASYDNGVLRIQIPISKEQRPRKISVTGGGESEEDETAEDRSVEQTQTARDDATRAKESAEQPAS